MAGNKMTNENVASGMRNITGRNTHWTTISRWKGVDIMPKIDGVDLDALIQVLDCTRDELLMGSDTP